MKIVYPYNIQLLHFVFTVGGRGKLEATRSFDTQIRGCINGDDDDVAVKKLKQGSSQGTTEWQAKINHLDRVTHHNIVRMIGFCSEHKQLLLVYEYMPNGSLDNYLRGGRSLPWDIRLKVVLGATKGLAYLHEVGLLFRDFKGSNILLDSEGPTGNNTHVTTRVVGTFAYIAPECAESGHATERCDVYSFDVVLTEILSGKIVSLDPKLLNVFEEREYGGAPIDGCQRFLVPVKGGCDVGYAMLQMKE
ncbi:hypothetical protein M8C21_008491, partial [Ambrosia artemisiifolia]